MISGADIRLFYMVYQRQLGESRGIVHFGHVAFLVVDAIAYVGHSGDDIHVKLAAKTFLNDLHVEQAEETASETEAERHRRLGRECQRRVVELQLFERCAKILEVFGLDGIDTGEDHGLDFLESLDGLVAWTGDVGDGITDLDLPSMS